MPGVFKIQRYFITRFAVSQYFPPKTASICKKRKKAAVFLQTAVILFYRAYATISMSGVLFGELLQQILEESDDLFKQFLDLGNDVFHDFHSFPFFVNFIITRTLKKKRGVNKS